MSGLQAEIRLVSPASVVGLLAVATGVTSISLAAWPHHGAARRLAEYLFEVEGPLSEYTARFKFRPAPDTGVFARELSTALRQLMATGILKPVLDQPCRALDIDPAWRSAHATLLAHLPGHERAALTQVGKWWAAASAAASNKSRSKRSA
jgi:hypothetical protein